jgi:hypothetical protein
MFRSRTIGLGDWFDPHRPYQSNRLKKHVFAQDHFPVYRARTPPISRHTLQSPQNASAKPCMSGLRIGSISWWEAPLPTVVRQDRQFPMAGTQSVQNGIDLRLVLSHHIQMSMSDLTAKQLFSVSCPTCGVAPGELCLLHSGGPRSRPHVERKLSAAEALETKRIPRDSAPR